MLIKIFRDIWDSRGLAGMLVWRNIRAKYRQSVFGLLWAFAPPLVVSIVWIFLKSNNVVGVEATGAPYPVYVITGVILWQTFADAIFAPILSIQNNKSILTKIFFKRISLFSAAFLETLFDFIVRLTLLVFVFLYYDFQHFTGFITVIPSVLILVLFGFAIGCLLAPVGALFSDISKGMNVVLTFWFFITPVIYDMKGIAATTSLIQINPVTHLLDTARSVLIDDFTGFSTPFVYWSIASFAMLFIGLYILSIAFPHIISRIGN